MSDTITDVEFASVETTRHVNLYQLAVTHGTGFGLIGDGWSDDPKTVTHDAMTADELTAIVDGHTADPTIVPPVEVPAETPGEVAAAQDVICALLDPARANPTTAKAVAALATLYAAQVDPSLLPSP